MKDTWILWAVIAIGTVVFKKINDVLSKIPEPELDLPDLLDKENLDKESTEEIECPDNEVLHSPMPSTRFLKSPIPNVEGGRLMLEVLDEVDELEEEGDTTYRGEEYTAESLSERIRDGVVMKEILDRKYF